VALPQTIPCGKRFHPLKDNISFPKDEFARSYTLLKPILPTLL
jgi:hypothetical protein